MLTTQRPCAECLESLGQQSGRNAVQGRYAVQGRWGKSRRDVEGRSGERSRGQPRGEAFSGERVVSDRAFCRGRKKVRAGKYSLGFVARRLSGKGSH